MSHNIQCEFEVLNWKLSYFTYTCCIQNKIIDENEKIERIYGVHLNKKTYQDVILVYFNDCKISKVPQGLTTIFPNMQGIVINNSNLTYIEREDLKEYNKLKMLYIENNKIQIFSENLLVDMKLLELFSMRGNKISYIEPDFLDGLDKLKYANFKDCGYINLVYDSIDPHMSDVSLQELKKLLSKKFQQSLWKRFSERQRAKTELFNHLKEAIDKNNLKDFKLIVDKEVFKIHKLVLAARSPVFAEMIENNPDAESLNLVDISPATFREIYNFMYTNEFRKSEEVNLVNLLIASEKLKIKRLANFAANALLYQITHENAFDLMVLGTKYGYEDLKKMSFEKIKEIFDGEEIDEGLVDNPEKLKKLIYLKNEEIRYINDLKQKFKNIMNEN
ncbi:hypothetical protein PVAND_000918 [Polypedilum vanderplanki]|uniref:BTB domain-containing protein n=1 Tax=Polypedilum vanderplanki TaxID=319348 RepID=A0A9J6BMN7_POLVA|nr:hypothetical protein PVAND_000918 [Polypedilum vanderplanki]